MWYGTWLAIISDLIICRSGALTISEITVCGKPSILIPFPHAAGDHQTKNAQVLVDSNAAKRISENTLTEKKLLFKIMNLIHNKNALDKMSKASKALGKPNATSKIVDQIFDTDLWNLEKLKTYFLLVLVELEWVALLNYCIILLLILAVQI